MNSKLLSASATALFSSPEIPPKESQTRSVFRRRETWMFVVLLALLNCAALLGSLGGAMIFLPEAVYQGEWWRLFTHPFVHVTWYHLLLDGAAFLILYDSLLEKSLGRRRSYIIAGGVGSLAIAWLAAPSISTNGLCGLSGIAHGLMAVSALEMIALLPQKSVERRIGFVTLALVIGKAALEALTGRMFFTFLHFGLMGAPVAVSHAGGVLGGLLAFLLFSSAARKARQTSQV